MPKQKPTVSIEEELGKVDALLELGEIQRLAYPLPTEVVGIYFLLHQDEIVYVGQSVNVIGRIMQHFISPGMIFDCYTYIELEAPLLNDAEWYYICKFQPKNNSSFGGKKYRMASSEFLTLDGASEYARNASDAEALGKYIRTYYPAVQGKYYSRALFRHCATVLRKEQHERWMKESRKPSIPKQDD